MRLKRMLCTQCSKNTHWGTRGDMQNKPGGSRRITRIFFFIHVSTYSTDYASLFKCINLLQRAEATQQTKNNTPKVHARVFTREKWQFIRQKNKYIIHNGCCTAWLVESTNNLPVYIYYTDGTQFADYTII